MMGASDPLPPVLETLALERRDDGAFAVCDPPPRWFWQLGYGQPGSAETLEADRLPPFVQAFLVDAERAWTGEAASRIDAGPWTETTPSGEEVHLEATALRVGGRELLLVARNDGLLGDRQRVLQRARELRRTHDALAREIERKDVLIHCIVHDLAGPLNSILGALSLLGEQPLRDASPGLVDVALKAAMRQRQLLREILDTFAAERTARAGAPDDLADPPDLEAAIAQVLEALSPMATSLGVRLGPPEVREGPRCRIVGEERRLTRVLFNLVQNAIRFSPRGAEVRVRVEDEDGAVRVTVDDEGPGVPADVAPRLFQKFARGGDPGAGSGLGLYFCRITVEHWGGAIGYEPRPGAGARFWLRLRCADTPGDVGAGEGGRAAAQRG